jgi:hypothetical protein
VRSNEPAAAATEKQHATLLVDYASPPAPAQPRFAWGVTIVTSIWILEVLAIAFLAAPYFRQVATDFKLKLSVVSRLVFQVCELLTDYWLWPALLLLPPAAGILAGRVIANGKEPSNRQLRGQLLRAVVYALIIATPIIAGIAFFMPMITLISGMTSGGGKK